MMRTCEPTSHSYLRIATRRRLAHRVGTILVGTALTCILTVPVVACGSSDDSRSSDLRERDEGNSASRQSESPTRSSNAIVDALKAVRSDALSRSYVPKVSGVKAFTIKDKAELDYFLPNRRVTDVSYDEVFRSMEERYKNLPGDERVFGPDTPVIVGAVLFDCSPVGNISISGKTRLLDNTVPRNPFVMYERPFSINRDQGEAPDEFQLTTSSGQGCIDILPAGVPADGWPLGPYSIEFLDGNGAVMAAIDFEVVSQQAKRSDSSARNCTYRSDGTAKETVEFFASATPDDIKICMDSYGAPNVHYEGMDQLIPDGATPLHLVAQYNDNPSVVTALVNGGASVDERTNEGFTPLHLAVRHGDNPGVITALADAGANPNVVSNEGHSPMHWAARYSVNRAIIIALARAGANPNQWTGDRSYTPLLVAAELSNDPAVVEALVDAGANPNLQRDSGTAPLHWASGKNSNPAIIKALVDAGADPNWQTPNGSAPLHWAAQFNSNPAVIIALLDAGADPLLQNYNGLTALVIAERHNDALKGTEAYRRLRDAR